MVTECEKAPPTYRLLDQCGEPFTLPPVGHLPNPPPVQSDTPSSPPVTPQYVTDTQTLGRALGTLPEQSVVTIAVSVIVVTIAAIIIISLTVIFLKKKRFQTLPKTVGSKQNQMRRKITTEEKRWVKENA